MFGRAMPEVKLTFEQLPRYLDQCFNGKLKELESSAGRIIKALDEAKSQFETACEAFERGDYEPDTEYTPRLSASYIKSSKGAYIKSLRSILVQHSHAAQADNIYSKYNYEQSEIEHMVDSVLKTNMQFNPVLLGYSDNLGNFKKSFSAMEKCSKSLKDELLLWGDEVGEYKAILGEINRIQVLDEEHRNIRSALESMTTKAGKDEVTPADPVVAMLEKERAKLSDIERRRAALEASIASTMMPLERAARKYDHSIGRKSKAADYITKPMESIADKASYSEFQNIIEAIYKEIESGGLEIKSKTVALHSVDVIRKGDVLRDIEEAKALDDELREGRAAVRDLERMAEEMHMRDIDSKNIEAEREAMLGKDAAIIREQTSIRKNIEDEFARFYKVRLSIETAH
jgi:hypothetical protein